MHCLALHEALRVDHNLLCGQLLRNLVQSLCDLTKVTHGLQLLALHLVRGLFDHVYARLHAAKLIVLFDL